VASGVTLPDPDSAGALTRPETAYMYDAVGNRTSLTDPLGNMGSFRWP